MTIPRFPQPPRNRGGAVDPNEVDRWLTDIWRALGGIIGVGWDIISKAGSKLSDIESRPHSMLQNVLGWTSGTDSTQVRHISQADGKVWQDHSQLASNTHHGLDHDATYALIGNGVTNGNSHDHSGGDGAQIDHGGTAGLGDDDHAQYLLLAGRPGQTATTPLVVGTATDNTTFEADGTPKFNGDATNWNDINKSLLPLSTGANVPNIVAVNGASYLKVRAFNGTATTNELGEGMEILHDYREGTDIHPHLHWAPTTADSGNVKWQLAYMWVERDGIFSSETIISVTTAAPGVAWKEQRINFPAISGAGHTIGSRFHFVLFRIPSDAADTYAHDAAAFDFGLHYERDTIGSRQITAK